MRRNSAVATCVIILAAAACKGSGGGVTPPDTTTPPPPPPPARVASVTLSQAFASVRAGATLQLAAQARDSSGATLTRAFAWTTSDQAVARVGTSGMVTAVAPGVALLIASVEGQADTASISVPLPTNTTAIKHVFVLVEENTEYPNVIGQSSMPYLNALAREYGLATEFYGSTHPSIGNYFAMTTGVVVSNDNNFSDTVDVDNVVRRLLAAGKTWKSYAEHLPYAGYTGSSSGDYARKHNPFSFFSDVLNDAVQRNNLVPFGQLAADLQAGTLPNYGFIVPNLCSDGHNCSLSVVDQWLQTNIGPLLRNAEFQNSGLLIITFDEGTSSINGGGHIATIVIGPRARRGFQSATLFQHPSLLRFTLSVLGVSSYPGGAASAPSMSGFLN